jgi:hypothetical protein
MDRDRAMNRAIYVFCLEIEYPEGSDKPGWWPASWYTLSDETRRKAIEQGFRWPPERMYLSRSGAYGRAWLLRWCGAKVTVRRSAPVTWPEPGEPDYQPDIAASWTYHRGSISPPDVQDAQRVVSDLAERLRAE